MSGKQLFLLRGGLCLLALAPRLALAFHHDKGDYVTAMKPCAPQAANTATTEGIPACSPPAPLSDCATNPGSAMRFGLGGHGSYVIRPTGRFLTINRDYVVDIDGTFRFAEIEACDGAKISGSPPIAMALRMALQDPACENGSCTLPDVTVLNPLPCSGRSCRERVLTTSFQDPRFGPQRIPSQFPWTAEMLSLNLLDGAGNPVASQGVLSGGTQRTGFPQVATAWEARMVRAYAPCDPNSANTVTSDGFPACSPPRPLSDCAADPQAAVGLDRLGKGKLRVSVNRRGGLALRGRFVGFLDCAGSDYNGSLGVAIMARITLDDSGCAGGSCTTVDTVFQVPMEVANGSGTLKGVRLAGVPRGNGGLINVEVLRAEVRDGAGRAVLAGHGFFVRCDPREGGARFFCYGN